MKQLFYFLKMQFVVKYLLNPGCKHSISASNFVEASILDKSAPLHDGKIQIFSRGRVPLHQIFNFYLSLRLYATNLHKKAPRCFLQLVKFAEMQSTAGETKHIRCKGPLSMNDKLSAKRSKHAND